LKNNISNNIIQDKRGQKGNMCKTNYVGTYNARPGNIYPKIKLTKIVGANCVRPKTANAHVRLQREKISD